MKHEKSVKLVSPFKEKFLGITVTLGPLKARYLHITTAAGGPLKATQPTYTLQLLLGSSESKVLYTLQLQTGARSKNYVGHSLKILDRFKKIWDPLRKLFATPSVPSWLWACFALMSLAFNYPALPTCLVVGYRSRCQTPT